MSRYHEGEADVFVWDDRCTGRICITWRSATHWDDIREDLKGRFRGHVNGLRFDPARKAWTLPAWQGPSLDEWLDWFFDPDCVAWEEPARHTSGHGSSGSYRAQNASASGSAIDEAYAALHLRVTAPLWAAEAVYKAAVKQTHPDAGGSHTAAVAINRAVELIRDHSQNQKARAS